MELIVFDLDGTLLNSESQISPFTSDTLQRLAARNIAYTVATGRTLHTSRALLAEHGFGFPQIYKNGVVIWNPAADDYSHRNLLTLAEIRRILEAFGPVGVAPFIFTLEPGNHHGIYHLPLQTEAERRLAENMARFNEQGALPAAQMPADADITNISAIGVPEAIAEVERQVADEPHLVAYSGAAIEGSGLAWIDIHHVEASKGGAVEQIKQDLGLSRVICFGDSDNDLSMFAAADEAYAPSNAKEHVKAKATAVIGHHDEDGIAAFLRERFDL